jgi:hypothetical protein
VGGGGGGTIFHLLCILEISHNKILRKKTNKDKNSIARTATSRKIEQTYLFLFLLLSHCINPWQQRTTRTQFSNTVLRRPCRKIAAVHLWFHLYKISK